MKCQSIDSVKCINIINLTGRFTGRPGFGGITKNPSPSTPPTAVVLFTSEDAEPLVTGLEEAFPGGVPAASPPSENMISSGLLEGLLEIKLND